MGKKFVWDREMLISSKCTREHGLRQRVFKREIPLYVNITAKKNSLKECVFVNSALLPTGI